MASSSETTMKKKLTGQAAGYLILAALVVASWAIFKILTPGNFGSPKNLVSYFEASLLAAVGAVGFYFVMVMGMFDFSIGANIMLSAIVGCVFATRFGMGYLGLIVGAVITGALVGLLNGVFYVKLRIPSMIVTTGLALIYESVANYIAGGVEQTLPSNLRAFGQMPGNLILAVIAFVAAYLLLNYTRIGTYTYAIGSNEFVAKNMGINVNKYKVLAFVISGAFLGVMAVLTISRHGYGFHEPQLCTDYGMLLWNGLPQIRHSASRYYYRRIRDQYHFLRLYRTGCSDSYSGRHHRSGTPAGSHAYYTYHQGRDRQVTGAEKAVNA